MKEWGNVLSFCTLYGSDVTPHQLSRGTRIKTFLISMLRVRGRVGQGWKRLGRQNENNKSKTVLVSTI